MQLKLITFFIIAFNILVVSNDLPKQVLFLSLFSLILSFFVKQIKLRVLLKIIMLITAVVILKINFKPLIVTEAAVSFLLILATLKFWELEKLKDHFNMFLILALSECSLFLLSPTFILFVISLLKMVFYFYYMLKIRDYDIASLSFKRLIILIIPSLLFAMALFYSFPRFTQGFINTSDLQTAFTGGNTHFNFKELIPLNPSTEPAFKVYGLTDEPLVHSLLYWRSNILWEFSGQEWRGGFANLKAPYPELNSKYTYKINLLQKNKEFLPTLDGASIVSGSQLPVNYYLEGTHRLKVITQRNVSYTVQGNYGDRNQQINSLMLRKGLRLKSQRINDVSEKLLKSVDRNLSNELKLKELIRVFKARDFEYSLNPPAYQSLEEFLINGKLGYCTHFAAAFTFLARTLGLPSRIVVGYLGGEINPYDQSVIVREQDAHSWVEIFLDEKGWVKIDPTALVAPARLQMSAGDFYQQLNPYLTLFNLKIDKNLFQFKFLKDLELWLDSLNTRFSSYVLNFDREEQVAFLRKISLSHLSAGWLFSLLTIIFLAAYYFVFLSITRKHRHSAEKRYRKFLRKMKSRGVTKMSQETATAFKIRCLAALPDEQELIENATAQYISAFYR